MDYLGPALREALSFKIDNKLEKFTIDQHSLIERLRKK